MGLSDEAPHPTYAEALGLCGQHSRPTSTECGWQKSRAVSRTALHAGLVPLLGRGGNEKAALVGGFRMGRAGFAHRVGM